MQVPFIFAMQWRGKVKENLDERVFENRKREKWEPNIISKETETEKQFLTIKCTRKKLQKFRLFHFLWTAC